MPVWHRITKSWRESGELVVVGIVQEQHPERARLWAQWQGIDWPILWDPLNLTNSGAVPNKLLVDEHGVVQSRKADPKTVEAEFVRAEFPRPESESVVQAAAAPEAHRLLGATQTHAEHPDHDYHGALSDALWGDDDALDSAIARVDARITGAPDDARATFRLGVLHRLRHDRRTRARSDDFQRAVDLWTGALALNPRQYIWRRRIQQFGPLLDKPYPFYPWLTEAAEAVTARGEEPVEIREHLSGAEQLGPKGASLALGDLDELPPPIDPGDSEHVRVETVVVPDTSSASGAVRVFVGLRAADHRVFWDHDAGPARIVVLTPDGPKRSGAIETHGKGHAYLDAWLDFDLAGSDAERRLRGVASVAVKSGRGHAFGLQHKPFEIVIPARAAR